MRVGEFFRGLSKVLRTFEQVYEGQHARAHRKGGPAGPRNRKIVFSCGGGGYPCGAAVL